MGQRDSEEFHDRFDKAREEMRRNWEEDDKFGEMWENGLIFKIIGGIAVFFVVVLVVGCCCVFSGQKNEPVPTVQTGYSQIPQQPGYVHQQPGYLPEQQGYVSQQPKYELHQPGYASQQPGYASQQPGNMGQQPTYKPQQADHKRQEAESEYEPTAPEPTPGLSGYEPGQLPTYDQVESLIKKY